MLFSFFFPQTNGRAWRPNRRCPGARVALQQDPRKACVTEKETGHTQHPFVASGILAAPLVPYAACLEVERVIATLERGIDRLPDLWIAF